jgi:uncharacterized RDD family membrane protein YckC
MRYVGVGRRFVAILIDGLVFAVLAAPFAEYIHTPGYYRVELTGGRVFPPSLLWLAYFVVMEGAIGASIGKLLVGVRVVSVDGSKLGWGGAVVRTIARIVDGFPYVLPYLVGAIAVWSSPLQQRLGDRWAGSVVVERASIPARGAVTYPGGGWTVTPPPPSGTPAPHRSGSAPPPMPPPPPAPPGA